VTPTIPLQSNIAAARLFRERGFDGSGLDQVMKAAGLTHGGCYKQFKSKTNSRSRPATV